MKSLETLLQKINISQRSIANFVGTSNTLISSCIAGTRTLPTNALLQLTQLSSLLKKLPAPTKPTPTPQEITDMQQQAIWCIAQCHPLKKQLAAMKQTYQQAATLVQLLDAYIANAETLSVKQKRWLDEQRYKAENKMTQNGWLPQQQIANKIALLTYEASLCKAADMSK